MQKLFITLSLATLVLFYSCDKVENPYPPQNANLGDTASCPAPTFAPLTTHIKKILAEDYTGHTCPNCPKAAKKIEELDTLYPNQIVPLALHVGNFATPYPGYNGSPSTAFLADYRTAAGTAYDATFKAVTVGLPEGMFNRKDFNAVTKTNLKFYPNFLSYVAGIVNEPSVVDLQLSADYNATTRKICLAVRDSFLTTLNDTLNLVVLLTQDSIIDWQDNIGVITSTYVHRHVLRDVITPAGAWGQSLASGTILAGTKHITKFAYNIPASFNGIVCDDKHCHIVAFIYRTANYEVLQAEEIKLIP